MMSGMGGYGTILVDDAGGDRALYLDASGKIPLAVDSDVYRAPTPGYLFTDGSDRRGTRLAKGY